MTASFIQSEEYLVFLVVGRQDDDLNPVLQVPFCGTVD